MKFFLSFLLLYSFQRTVSRLVCRVGGDEENRTPDPLLARQVLSQLSYTPMVLFFKAFSIVFSFSFAWKNVVGLTRLELVTSRLSGVRSNQLSYGPENRAHLIYKTPHFFSSYFQKWKILHASGVYSFSSSKSSGSIVLIKVWNCSISFSFKIWFFLMMNGYDSFSSTSSSI